MALHSSWTNFQLNEPQDYSQMEYPEDDDSLSFDEEEKPAVVVDQAAIEKKWIEDKINEDMAMPGRLQFSSITLHTQTYKH